MEFKIGDIVELKSGGPEMTVQNIIGVTTNKTENFTYTTAGYSEGDLVCKWFAGDKLESAIFKPATVDIIED